VQISGNLSTKPCTVVRCNVTNKHLALLVIPYCGLVDGLAPATGATETPCSCSTLSLSSTCWCRSRYSFAFVARMRRSEISSRDAFSSSCLDSVKHYSQRLVNPFAINNNNNNNNYELWTMNYVHLPCHSHSPGPVHLMNVEQRHVPPISRPSQPTWAVSCQYPNLPLSFRPIIIITGVRKLILFTVPRRVERWVDLAVWLPTPGRFTHPQTVTWPITEL